MTTGRRSWVLGAMMAAAAIAMSPDLAGQVRMTGAASAADDLFTKFFEQYGRGEITVGALPDEQAREFARELQRTGPPWAGPGNEPDGPRRRLLVATIAIDFINQNFERAWGVGYPGELLEWACELLRGTAPAPAERAWHLAAVALLQRASASRLVRGPVSAATGNTAVVTHIIHAERRFPDDGEWALARAIDAEHLTWPPALTEDILRPPPDHENRIRSRMQDAFEVASVRDEARLRWAYFETRRGRFAQALEEFDDVGSPSDPVVRFWLHLLRGRTLVRMEQAPEAVESYRKALAEFPHAQSATLALGAAFVNRGQATAARELVSAFLGSSPGTDPWRAYGSPAQRHWPRLYVELRQAIQP